MPMIRRPHHLPCSPIKVDQSTMEQGIVAILHSDCERSKAPTIRRTLSADMSSKKWLEQNGLLLSPLKKIASTNEMAISISSHDSSSSSEGELEEFEKKRPGHDEVWQSIQLQKTRDETHVKPKGDVWGSLILTQKSENNCDSSTTLPPPYVHPMVKRSSSILSEKSLEICTESLGSETGLASDGFSSYSPSEFSDQEEKELVTRDEKIEETYNFFEELHVPKYKVSPARPFPPPIPSIVGGDGAGALHMYSHRENGRLVLEAVSVPPRNYFHAQRGDGRLVLTLISGPVSLKSERVEENEVEEFEEVFDKMDEFDEKIEEEKVKDVDCYEEEEDEEAEEEKIEFVMEQNIKSLPSKMTSVHKSGLLMKKVLMMNKNPTWSNKFNKAVNMMESIEGEQVIPIPQSLPPPPRVARLVPPPPPPATASFNAYEYFWRTKSPVSGNVNTTSRLTNNNDNNNKTNSTKAYEHQDLVVRRGNKSENFVPYFRGCKEGRRSLSIWEPYCIATS